MDSLHQAIEAARLLGRWALVAERHGNGCSCCPGLGEVSMDEVEARLAEWLRGRHAVLSAHGSVTGLLRDCIARRCDAGPEDLKRLFADLAEALDDLERIQAGLA